MCIWMLKCRLDFFLHFRVGDFAVSFVRNMDCCIKSREALNAVVGLHSEDLIFFVEQLLSPNLPYSCPL
jgi:hypothetical protein